MGAKKTNKTTSWERYVKNYCNVKSQGLWELWNSYIRSTGLIMSEIHFKLSQSVKGEIHVTNSLWGWEWNWVEGPNTIWLFFFMCVFSLCVNWFFLAWFSQEGPPGHRQTQTLPYSFCLWRKRVFSERGWLIQICITFHYLIKMTMVYMTMTSQETWK